MARKARHTGRGVRIARGGQTSWGQLAGDYGAPRRRHVEPEPVDRRPLDKQIEAYMAGLLIEGEGDTLTLRDDR